MKMAIFMDNPLLDTPPVHETTGFHGQPHQKLNFVHETGHFHGQQTSVVDEGFGKVQVVEEKWRW